MKNRSAPWIAACCAAASLLAAGEASPKRLLYITTTAGFHHSACEYSVPIIQKIAAASMADPLLGAFEVVCSDKTDLITAESLKQFDAVCFSNTSGDLAQFPLSEANRNALLDAIKGGLGFVGIHATSDTYKDWPPFVEMIGGAFHSHPWHETVTIDIEDPSHPAAVPVPSPWVLKDEIYAFNHFSRDAVHVIMSLNPASLKGRGHRTDGDYAIAWCKLHGKGRVFYTALGHDHELWDDPRYQQHLLGGIRWALGAARQEPYRPNQRGERVGLVKGSAQGDALLTIGHRKTDAPWQPILDGKPLAWGADWEATDDKERTRKHWTVCADGILTGDSRGVEGDGSSHIYYIKKAYKNFEVRAEISINEDGNSGFYFRCPRGENERGGRWRNWPSGYEAQINLSHGDPKRSGTHYASPTVWAEDIAQVLGYAQGKVKADDFWYTMRIVAVGDHTVIFLNDRMVVDHIGPAEGKKRYTEGLFAFQMHHRGTVVRLKNLAVRELSPDLR